MTDISTHKVDVIAADCYLPDEKNFYLEYNRVKVCFPPHLHCFAEIELITAGSGYEEIDGKVYAVEEGDITIMIPDEEHSYICKSEEKLEITSIKVGQHFMPEELARMKSSLLVKALPEGDKNLLNMLCGKIYAIQNDVEKKLSLTIVQECLRVIMLICQTHEKEIPAIETPETDRLHQALLHIHKNFRRNLTVAEVAEEVYLVPNYFSTWFEKNMGISCSKYINKLRTELAYEYIIATEMSLKEIVYKCGFHSFSYFSSVFRNYYGCSPGDIRKKKKIHSKKFKEEDRL